MNRSPAPIVAVALLLAAPGLQASSRSSASYQITAESLDSGGAVISAGVYSMDTAIGVIGQVSSAGAPAQLVNRSGYIGQLPSIVAARLIFYNESAWDGNNPAANGGVPGASNDDDDAIATDKVALLPGGTATFANYTSYSRGINGVMVDVTELGAAPTVDDFVFKVGNNNSPSGWATAPSPSSITVRWGAGVGGSDRVTFIWANNAIQQKWLQVTTKADAATGLGGSDVFYFGNAIGDTGDAFASNRAVVNTADEAGVRLHPRNFLNPAPVTDPYDFDRNKQVNTADEATSRLNPASFLTGLMLISPGGSVSLLGAPASGFHQPATADATADDSGASRLLIEQLDAGRLQISVGIVPGRSYELQVADAIAEPVWSTVAGQSAVVAGVASWLVPVAPASQAQFFRLIDRSAPSVAGR